MNFIFKGNQMKKLLIALLFASAANSAFATVIDFNELTFNTDLPNYTSNGYTFTSSPQNPTAFYSYGGNLFINHFNISVTLSRPDNLLFDFNSIDLLALPNFYINDFNVTFSGTTDTNDTVNETFSVSDISSTYTFKNGFSNLKSVTWSQNNNFSELHIFDNVNVTTLTSQTAAVPEPETYAMFMAGLGLMGFVSRRRKSA